MAINLFIVGILLWFGYVSRTVADCSLSTPSVYTFGSECQHMCHCKDGASCDAVTGECSVGCDSNWFGPGCQYRDKAESQYARHNSNSNPPHWTYKAVDGDKSTCSYTREANLSHERPWVRVWFPQNETIRNISILTTNDKLSYFAGFEVTVEYVPNSEKANNGYEPTYKHTCYQHSNTVPENNSIEVQCDQPIVGNQVRITLSSEQSQLVLCDVRISAGRNFAFRKYVTSSHYNSNYPPRNAVDGRLWSNVSSYRTGCFAASNTGNKYLDINLGTSIYTYSVNINTSSVDNIKDYLIYTAPTAQTGLQLAYNDTGNWPPVTYVHINTHVQQLLMATHNSNQMIICELEIYGECPANKCGYDCSENCYCKSHEDMEHRVSGVCTTGCQVRWTGSEGKCNIKCDVNKWGTQCQNECGACRIGTCDAVSGECTGGCQDGYQDSTDCKNECDDGTYGIGCAHNCVSVCATTCYKVNGHCLQCPPGWKGNFCETECNLGQYGLNCAGHCGFCKAHTICDKAAGVCPSGCMNGYTGPTCDEESTNHMLKCQIIQHLHRMKIFIRMIT